jgi:hypothetical protein
MVQSRFNLLLILSAEKRDSTNMLTAFSALIALILLTSESLSMPPPRQPEISSGTPDVPARRIFRRDRNVDAQCVKKFTPENTEKLH